MQEVLQLAEYGCQPWRQIIEHLPRHKRTKFHREVRALRVAQHRLNQLLELTACFQQDLFTHLERIEPYPQQRCVVAFQSGMLAVEHSVSTLRLLTSGFNTSAFALVRPQFESLLRGVWLLHAATEDQVFELSQPITAQTSQSASEAPMVADMLKELMERAPQHRALAEQLTECYRESGRALTNFMHGGLHALSRADLGYPPQLVFNVLRISNSVTLLTGQLLVVLAGNPANMPGWREVRDAYLDCFPLVTSH